MAGGPCGDRCRILGWRQHPLSLRPPHPCVRWYAFSCFATFSCRLNTQSQVSVSRKKVYKRGIFFVECGRSSLTFQTDLCILRPYPRVRALVLQSWRLNPKVTTRTQLFSSLMEGRTSAHYKPIPKRFCRNSVTELQIHLSSCFACVVRNVLWSSYPSGKAGDQPSQLLRGAAAAGVPTAAP